MPHVTSHVTSRRVVSTSSSQGRGGVVSLGPSFVITRGRVAREGGGSSSFFWVALVGFLVGEWEGLGWGQHTTTAGPGPEEDCVLGGG
jgi:hypothetical protein